MEGVGTQHPPLLLTFDLFPKEELTGVVRATTWFPGQDYEETVQARSYDTLLQRITECVEEDHGLQPSAYRITFNWRHDFVIDEATKQWYLARIKEKEEGQKKGRRRRGHKGKKKTVEVVG